MIIKYKENGSYLYDKNEDKCENNITSLKINNNKKTYFENLTIVNTTTTFISSIYENLNQITKYKLSKDMKLRKKIILFLMEESNKVSSNCSIIDSNNSSKIKINNSLYVHERSNSCSYTFSKHHLKSQNSKYDEDRSFMFSYSKEESLIKDMKPIRQIKRNSSKFSKLDDSTRHLSPEINKSNILKKKRSLFKTSDLNSSGKSICKIGTEKFEFEKNKNGKKKETIQNLKNSTEEGELNFYGKLKTLRGNNNFAMISSNNDFLKSPKKNNYLDIISHNILENRKTLNNPQEFYMDFFSNIVQRSINKRKKYNKSRKETYTKKTGEVNKRRNTIHKYLSNNNDDQKIKKKWNTKRRSTPNIVVKHCW